MTYTPFRFKRDNFCVWPFYDHLWSFFCQLHRHLSQKLGSDGYFEVLNKSKSQLDQKLQDKTQNFLSPLFFNYGRKNLENL